MVARILMFTWAFWVLVLTSSHVIETYFGLCGGARLWADPRLAGGGSLGGPPQKPIMCDVWTIYRFMYIYIYICTYIHLYRYIHNIPTVYTYSM